MLILNKKIEIDVYMQEDGNKFDRYRFSYPETKIEFNILQSDVEAPDSCFVKIYGVSLETYGIFKLDDGKKNYDNGVYASIKYGDMTGMNVIYTGKVSRATYSFANGNQVLSILLDKNMTKFLNKIATHTFNRPTTFEEIGEIIFNKFGYKVLLHKSINKNDLFLSAGRHSVSGTLDRWIKSFAIAKKYMYRVYMNEIYIFPRYYKDEITGTYISGKEFVDGNSKKEIMLCMDNGLISYPTEDTNNKKFTFKSIAMAVDSGDIIKIPYGDIWYSESDNGRVYKYFSVEKYNTTFSNDIGSTSYECREIKQ